MAENLGQSLSEYVVRMMEMFFDQNTRTDLLIRKMHEEILQLEDMVTLMHGFNMEVYTTLLARTSKPMDEAEKKELQEYRKKAVDGLQGYLEKVSQKIIAGEDIWHKETENLGLSKKQANQQQILKLVRPLIEPFPISYLNSSASNTVINKRMKV